MRGARRAIARTNERKRSLVEVAIEEDSQTPKTPSQEREQLRQRIHAWVAVRWKPPSWSRSRRQADIQKTDYDEDLTKPLDSVPRTIFPRRMVSGPRRQYPKAPAPLHPAPACGPDHAPRFANWRMRATFRACRKKFSRSRCDPACGWALFSFRRFGLDEALVESLHHHKRLDPNPTGVGVRLRTGRPHQLGDETIPSPRRS